ncbi:pirin-like C-terminal cupin domain-containing protein [Streptomyces hawaiiensis]|uniref:pirin-like C-terminal cupin domain-containing protein n=1 Tax=Streptomyces hawaiiensis TaxID=67305 RepID=UPI003656FB35
MKGALGELPDRHHGFLVDFQSLGGSAARFRRASASTASAPGGPAAGAESGHAGPPGIALQHIALTANGLGPWRRAHSKLAAALDHAQPLPADHRAFAFVLDGRAWIGNRRVEKDQIAWSDPWPGATRLSAPTAHAQRRPAGPDHAVRGRPLGEPAVAVGAFVMNSRAEVEQAFQDFHSGTFGQIPRAARLQTRCGRLSPRSRMSSRYGCTPFPGGSGFDDLAADRGDGRMDPRPPSVEFSRVTRATRARRTLPGWFVLARRPRVILPGRSDAGWRGFARLLLLMGALLRILRSWCLRTLGPVVLAGSPGLGAALL